jgi:hypothetical protein
MNDQKFKIPIHEIGEFIRMINGFEIAFRLENLLVVGYRWAVVGHEKPEPGQMQLYRAEIDDGIQGTLTYTNDVPDKLRFFGFEKEMFSIENPDEQLKNLHIMQKDWIERGEAEDLQTAVTDLCEAVCRVYPNSDFEIWYRKKVSSLISADRIEVQFNSLLAEHADLKNRTKTFLDRIAASRDIENRLLNDESTEWAYNNLRLLFRS